MIRGITQVLAVSVICFGVEISTHAFAADEITAEQKEFFESKIRPIFVEHCYECHSVSADDIEGGLLLDSKWGWETGGDTGPAIVPGDPDESLVIEAIRYQEDVVSAMPPRSKLSAEKIALLEKWVKEGASDPRPKSERVPSAMVETFDLKKRYEEHWSWRDVVSPTPPEVLDPSWPRSDVDRFVLEKIETAGLRPAREADRPTWLRRVYFDLIGLPPTGEQLTAFENDESADAHEKVVTELLDSPHFGEKWARHWMDLVRYAETYGHEFDYPIDQANEYRDYLIRAFNADVPYDQFVREQIAGDLIEEPRRHTTDEFNESVIGTGFWYLHEATHSPTDVLGNEADIIDNQIDVLGKTFLGLTVACARCHDHKFDAISTADYYALSAYLQSSCRQRYPLDPGRRIEEATERITALRRSAIDSLRTAEIDFDRLAPSRYFRAASQLIRDGSDALPGDAAQLPAPGEQQIKEAAETNDLETSRLTKWVQLLTAVDLKQAPTSLSAFLAKSIQHPDRRQEVVARREAEQKRVKEFDGDSRLFTDFSAAELPPGWSTTGSAFAMTGDRTSVALDGWLPRPNTIDSGGGGRKQTGILRSPTFEITTRQIHLRMRATANVKVNVVIDNYQMAPFNALLFGGTFMNGGSSDTKDKWQWKTLGGDLKKYLGHKAYLEFVDQGEAAVAIDEIRFSDRGPVDAFVDELAVELSGPDDAMEKLWRGAVADLHAGKRNGFLDWLITHDLVGIQDLSPKAANLVDQAVAIASELPQPRYVIAMAEGTTEAANIYVRGSHVSLGDLVPPRYLEALGGEQGDRLALAKRIASAENPLTSRVIVNRVWHHLFGRGIVASVDDFGPQGQPPSHPELLDRLASNFVAQGWSIKSLIRDLVLSGTYRQSSRAHPKLSRETIATVDPTNTMLFRMRVRRLPAESIRDGILAVSGRLDRTQFGGSVATHRNEFMTGRGARGSGPLDGNGRRTVYLSVYRNFISPFMLTFDMPSPFGPKGRRSVSNVPAQALTLMNDPFVIEQAKVWAAESLRDAGWSDRERITRMVRQAHGVVPNEQQLVAFEEFLKQQTNLHGRKDERVWADFAHALFNMKAFYFLR